MVLSTTRVAFLAAMVAALGIGLWAAVGFASPKDNGDDGHHDNDKGRTLTVLTKTRQEKVVDLDPQGATQGDMRVVNAPLYNASGKQKVGRFDLVCVSTDPAEEANEKYHMAQCTYTYTLRAGAADKASTPILGSPRSHLEVSMPSVAVQGSTLVCGARYASKRVETR